MCSQVTKTRAPKTALEKLKGTFYRLKKKKENLEVRLKELTSEFDEAMVLYHSKLRMSEKVCGSLICDFIDRLLELVEDTEILNNREKENFYHSLVDSVNLVYSLLPLQEIPQSVQELYPKLFGREYKDEFREEMENLSDFLNEHLGVEGIDLSEINPEDDSFNLFEKLFEAISESQEKIKEKELSKNKSKKKLSQELKAKQLEDLQNKNLSNIYKRLAKELHPDLEQDPEKKSEKQEQMKRLTAAYENSDLLSLLSIESQCFADAVFTCDETTLNAYNALLKTQIKEIEIEMNLLFQSPRYIEMSKYTNKLHLCPLEAIEDAIFSCSLKRETYSKRLSELSGPSGLKALKKFLKQDNFFLQIQPSIHEILNLS